MLFGLGVALRTNFIKLPITKEIHSQTIPGLEDDRRMVGISHNVFVGKVAKEAGAKDTDIIPTTQFNVEVLYNIKGDLSGTVTVSQEGGYRNGILYVVRESDVALPAAEGEDIFLQPGSLYLFFTRYNETENWHDVMLNPNGTSVLAWDKKMNTAQIQVFAENDARIKELQEAYKNEILLDADVKNNNVRNSYQSLQTIK